MDYKLNTETTQKWKTSNKMIKYTIHLILPLLLFMFSACNLNKMYLQPTEMKPDAKSATLYLEGDTVTINYIGEHYQPQFIRNGKDTVEFDYTIESTLFESTSGNLLNGWMLTPKDVKPKATLLFFHGNAGFITSQHWSMTLLLKYGYQAFVIDYSGYGFSEGRATRKNVLKDGNSALNYILTRPDVKGTDIVLYGQSLGGHLATVVAAQNQDKIDALVVEGAFSSHKDIGIHFAGFLGKIFVKEQYSAIESVQQFNKPILVIHSTEDNVVPFEMGKKIYDHANEPKAFYEIDGCHICGARIYNKEIAQKIAKMIAQ
ncbi:alpha/beta hydrolase [Brumimicrobium sp.]|uniref:alpha/beta hydrolase n=1 Tax=Brumimicrobium sp. TaxID=2029867 RepID=UPI003A933621